MRKFIFLLALSTSLLLLTAEITLRCLGFIPGFLIPKHVLPEFEMDLNAPLIPSNEFASDEQGILHFNQPYFDTCSQCPNSKLFHYLKQAKANNWGFRQNATKAHNKGKKIMLIGDSFTWGFSSTPLDSSFADQLHTTYGYNIYNLGIPGTDPVQYEAVVHRYLDSIRPDWVILNFYMGNDFVYSPKRVIPFKNTDHFTTPFLWFPSTAKTEDDSIYVFPSGKDAQAYFLELISFGRHSHSPVKQWMAKSCITTFLGYLLLGNDDTPYTYTALPKKDHTAGYLRSIDSFCVAQQTPCLFFVIPDKQSLQDFSPYVDMAEKNWKSPSVFFRASPEYYVTGRDVHFNNSGHRAYAAFIDSVLKAGSR